MEVILLAQRECPKCGNEFLIENGAAKLLSGGKEAREIPESPGVSPLL
jgi:hypothetical protein